MQKAISIATLVWLASQAHAQTTPIESPVLASYAGKNLGVVTHAPPKIGLLTAGQTGATMPINVSGLGVLGGALFVGLLNGAVSANFANTRSKLVSQLETGFADPAVGIAHALTGALKVRQGTPLLADFGVATDHAVESAIATVPTAQWLVEVSTVSWGVVHFPTDWSHYRIPYAGKLRVIDVESKRVIAESVCQNVHGETRRPNIEQLATRDASLLRFYFQQAQFECADQFAAKVFGLAALPRPTDALTDYRDNLSTDDETAVPDLPKAGQDDYKLWLTKNGPKAFVVGGTIKWGWGIGMKPSDPAAPIDVTMRALYNCKRNYKQNCKLYAINGKVVEGTDYAERMQALFERGSNAPKAPAQDATGTADTPPAQPVNLTPTGFAKVTEFDLAPYLSDKGRAAYKAWLDKPGPKAFSISPAGYYAESVGTKPAEAGMPSDPAERSLLYCNKYSPTPCKLYAVNGEVVFALEW